MHMGVGAGHTEGVELSELSRQGLGDLSSPSPSSSSPGASYLLMGQVEENKGPILPPESFVVLFRPTQDQILNNLSKRKCPSQPRLAA